MCCQIVKAKGEYYIEWGLKRALASRGKWPLYRKMLQGKSQRYEAPGDCLNVHRGSDAPGNKEISMGWRECE